MNKQALKNARGFILLEVIISFGVITILIWAFAAILFQSRNISTNNLRELRALMLNREMIEIAKDLEKSDWNELTNPACAYPLVCHPEVSDSAWVLKSGRETTNGFSRTITVSPVFRSQSSFPNTLVPLGVSDSNTLKITGTVQWTAGTANKSTTLEVYVHKL